MVIKYADLHTHTTASDGTQSPARNVQMAKAAGLFAVAITDHDTVAGLSEAMKEGRLLDIKVIPGVEISTAANQQDIHVLGYYMDLENPLFLGRLEQLRNTRDRRNEMIVERLQELGLAITLPEVIAAAGNKLDNETIGRPHIADLLVKKGFVSSIGEAFAKYLGNEGAAYVNPPRIHPNAAIDWIKEAGGCAILAHPGLYRDIDLVEQLVSYGLDGIEVYHSDHSEEDVATYKAIADRHKLIITGGSDFHGERNGVVFHAPIGSTKINADVLSQLTARAR